MRIALFNVKIIIQKNEIIVDDIGNHKNVWRDYHSCYGTVSGEGGFEKTVAGVIKSDSDISFTTRYCRALSYLDTTQYRVLFHGEIYNIAAIDHMNYKKKALKLRCEKTRS